jgi:drug/metabolite transporter (DMT)-like permease
LAPRTLVLTAAALVCFAANSLLCRAALRPGLLDPASFTAVRLAAGAVALGLLARRGGRTHAGAGGWWSATALFAYAIFFSWAYLRLTAGMGALLLFGAVQVTMFVGGRAAGQRPRATDWLGLGLAAAGLLLLTAPSVAAPDRAGALAMLTAGAAWGLYTLRGRGEARPLLANAGNFLRTLPGAAAALVAAPVLLGGPLHATPAGLLLAAVSGAVTSGLGYAIWYAALAGLTPVRAGLVQLAVPVLAALGGVVLLGEQVSARLVASAVLVLGGIALALLARQRR